MLLNQWVNELHEIIKLVASLMRLSPNIFMHGLWPSLLTNKRQSGNVPMNNLHSSYICKQMQNNSFILLCYIEGVFILKTDWCSLYSPPQHWKKCLPKIKKYKKWLRIISSCWISWYMTSTMFSEYHNSMEIWISFFFLFLRQKEL